MKDEIKEILDDLKEDVEQNILIEVRGNVFKPLLDYITNLQDKEKLEEIFKKYYEDEVEKNNKLQTKNIELVLERDKYKSRNEKAMEYIKVVGVLPKQIDSFVLLNILKGENNGKRKSNRN